MQWCKIGTIAKIQAIKGTKRLPFETKNVIHKYKKIKLWTERETRLR